MNILYISSLVDGKYSGPYYSVPKQIKFQSLYDNVYWINLTNLKKNDFMKSINGKNIRLSDFNIRKLEKEFNKVDLVVFEEFFKIKNAIVARKLEKRKIPYIIIPRCQMTRQYLNHKKVKKKLALILLFKHFVEKSAGVQFLTNQELEDSKEFYSKNYCVIPNGVDINEISTAKNINKKSEKKIVFIGRYSIVQKGLDLLIEAISYEKDILAKNNIHFYFYGPDERTGEKNSIINIINKYKVGDLITINGPIYDDEKKKVLKNSDYFIHTSRFEGLPMSVLEALSYGLPCLLTDGSNLRLELENYNAGWGASTDVDGIRNALNKLCDDIDNYSNYSNNALKMAESFSWNSIAKISHTKYSLFI